MHRLRSNISVQRTAMSMITAFLVTAAVFLLISASAVAGGGLSTSPEKSGKPGKAKLLPNGKAIPPDNAPKRIVKAIKAANEIRKTKYVWGGGHGSFDSGMASADHDHIILFGIDEHYFVPRGTLRAENAFFGAG